MHVKIKDTLNSVEQSWCYKNPLTIVIIVLVTVIMVQNFSYLISLPSISYTTVIENEPPELVACNYKCLTLAWVELRTLEIMVENQDKYRLESRYQALVEANQLITQI